MVEQFVSTILQRRLFLQDRSIQFEKQKTDIRLMGSQNRQQQKHQCTVIPRLIILGKKKLKPNFQYRPLENQKVMAIESHKNQFYYLTQKAVLSHSFGGKFYVEHGLKNPILLGMGKDKSFLILTDKALFFFDKEGRLDISLDLSEKAHSVQFDTRANRYLILTPKHLYEFRPQDQSLKKVYSGSRFSSLEQFMEKIWIGSNKGIHRLNARNFDLEKNHCATPP